MARQKTASPVSLGHYRNFAVVMLVLGVGTALISEAEPEQAGDESAYAEKTKSHPVSKISTTPIMDDSLTDQEFVSADITADKGLEEPEPVTDAAASDALPKIGLTGPANKPHPRQLAELIASSKERSGAPMNGD